MNGMVTINSQATEGPFELGLIQLNAQQFKKNWRSKAKITAKHCV